MIITVYCSKGGVGKTPIATNILLDNKDFYIATNENNSGYEYMDSIQEEKKILINPEDAFTNEEETRRVLKEANTSMIIDLSGSLGESLKSISTALKMSDVVIVPINDQMNSLIQGRSTVQDIRNYYPDVKIIVAATKLERQGPKDVFGNNWEKCKSFKEIKEFVEDEIKDGITYVPLKFSKGYENLMKTEISIIEMAKVPFSGHSYKLPAEQLKTLYKTLGI